MIILCLTFLVSFTAVIVILTSFTLVLQTNTLSVFTNIFDMVKLEKSPHANEQQLFLISLLAFPILNVYLAVNIEVNIH